MYNIILAHTFLSCIIFGFFTSSDIFQKEQASNAMLTRV